MAGDTVEVVIYSPAALQRIMRELGMAPSRREQRRARKAAKNLAMYKMAGRRPWGIADDVLSWPSAYNWTPAKVRHLREPSGFKRMSQFADYVADPKSGYVHRNLQGRGDK